MSAMLVVGGLIIVFGCVLVSIGGQAVITVNRLSQQSGQRFIGKVTGLMVLIFIGLAVSLIGLVTMRYS